MHIPYQMYLVYETLDDGIGHRVVLRGVPEEDVPDRLRRIHEIHHVVSIEYIDSKEVAQERYDRLVMHYDEASCWDETTGLYPVTALITQQEDGTARVCYRIEEDWWVKDLPHIDQKDAGKKLEKIMADIRVSEIQHLPLAEGEDVPFTDFTQVLAEDHRMVAY